MIPPPLTPRPIQPPQMMTTMGATSPARASIVHAFFASLGGQDQAVYFYAQVAAHSPVAL